MKPKSKEIREGNFTYTQLLEWFYYSTIKYGSPITSGWFRFILHFAEKGWGVHIRTSSKNSKYITISHNGLSKCVRVSDHYPNHHMVDLKECDYWIGPIKGLPPLTYREVIADIEKELSSIPKAKVLHEYISELDTTFLLRELGQRSIDELDTFINYLCKVIRRLFSSLVNRRVSKSRKVNIESRDKKPFLFNSIRSLPLYNPQNTIINLDARQSNNSMKEKEEEVKKSAAENEVDFTKCDEPILKRTRREDYLTSTTVEKPISEDSKSYNSNSEELLCNMCLSPVSKGACTWQDCPLDSK